MIKLIDKESGAELGLITEEQMQFLIDQLEEEYTEDQDYYLNQATLDNFESEGIDPDLLEILKRALGDREEMEIVWSRE